MDRYTTKETSYKNLPYEVYDNINRKTIAAFCSKSDAESYANAKSDGCLDFNMPGTNIWYKDCKPVETCGDYIIYSTICGGRTVYIVVTWQDDVVAMLPTRDDAMIYSMKLTAMKHLLKEENNERKESM